MTDTVQKARKQYSCWWCGEAINPGDTYARLVCKDRGLSVTMVHLECELAWYEKARLDGGVYECGFADHKRPAAGWGEITIGVDRENTRVELTITETD